MGFSSFGSQALENRRNSCGTGTELFHGMWDLPGSKPLSAVLAGGFFTIEPQGSPHVVPAVI